MPQGHCFFATELALRAGGRHLDPGPALVGMRLRVAVVGGGIGPQHVAAYRKLPELYEVRTSATSTVPGREHGRALRDPVTLAGLRGAAEHDDLDLIDICTPPRASTSCRPRRPCGPGSMLVCEKPVARLAGRDGRAHRGRAESGSGVADLPVPVRQRLPEAPAPQGQRRSRPGLSRHGRDPLERAGAPTTRCPGAGAGRLSLAAASSPMRSMPTTCWSPPLDRCEASSPAPPPA